MSIVGNRLREAMAHRHVEQQELADQVGCSQGAISQILLGSTQRSRFLPEIADYLHVPIKWLRGEIDSHDFSETLPPKSSDLDLVSIPEINLAFGMGATFTDVPIETKMLQFPRSWVAAITSSSPANLLFARGRGDSMMPTMLDGDMVLIDQSQGTIREQDAIWAIAMGDVGMIKRVRSKSGTYTILSDNPNVPADQAVDDEMQIIGRVVFIGRRM